MSEARIGRIFVASLHQAIADLAPMRLEFYEGYLRPLAMRHGTIGLASFSAALSFLRREDEASYNDVVRRAGSLAADWTWATHSGTRRVMLRVMPSRMRARLALRTAQRMVADSYPGSRSTFRLRKQGGTVTVRGSVFCEVRSNSRAPLCGFYAAAIERLLGLANVPGDVQISGCRVLGGQTCELSIWLGETRKDAGRREPPGTRGEERSSGSAPEAGA